MLYLKAAGNLKLVMTNSWVDALFPFLFNESLSSLLFNFSLWLPFKILTSISSAAVALALIFIGEIFRLHGVPSSVRSDCGYSLPHNSEGATANLLHSSAHHPQSNRQLVPTYFWHLYCYDMLSHGTFCIAFTRWSVMAAHFFRPFLVSCTGAAMQSGCSPLPSPSAPLWARWLGGLGGFLQHICVTHRVSAVTSHLGVAAATQFLSL